MPQGADKPNARVVNVREGVHKESRVYFVELTQGHEAIVQPADWQRIVEQYGERWNAMIQRGHIYARKAATFADGTIRMVALHRAIADAQPDERVVALNGNALDCRYANLSKRRFRGKVAQRRREQFSAREMTKAETG